MEDDCSSSDILKKRLKSVEVDESTNLHKNIEINLPKYDVNTIKSDKDLLKNNPRNVFNFEVQENLIEKLEDWKDKQMILFNEKLKTKEEELLNELSNKCIDNRKRTEEELTSAISKCKYLAENMTNIIDEINEMEAAISAKKRELKYQKDSMENKYIDLIQNVQSSNVQNINELSNNILELETKLLSEEKKQNTLRKENEKLKDDINCSLRIQQLKNTIINLKSNCEEYNNEWTFYKDRWLRNVKEIKKIRTKINRSKANKQIEDSF